MKYNSKVKVQLYEISPEELVELIKDSVVKEMKDLIMGMDKKIKVMSIFHEKTLVSY